MADSDKNIIITPNRGATSQPTVSFTGQGNDPITLRVLDGTTGTGITAGGAISFEGSAGQLFSVVNRLGTGSIFSVNDISGIPSIDVDANGTIELAPFTGYVAIGLTAPAEKLHVIGNMRLSGGLSAASATFSNDIVVNGVRVGEGGGSVATNVAVGQSALNANTTGARNVAFGAETLTTGATTSDVTAVGYRTLYVNLGDNNTAVGSRALDANTTGIRNTAVGDRALTDQTTGSNNTAIGFSAISSNSTGFFNTAVGDQASTTGTTASNTTAVGYRALYLNTVDNNTAVGSGALDANTTGVNNTAVGSDALGQITTGSWNVAIGFGAADALTTTGSNVAIGRNALGAANGSQANVVIGTEAGANITTGSQNVIIGSGQMGVANPPAVALTSNVNNVVIGFNAQLAANNANNIVIGCNAVGEGDNTTVIGNSSTTSTRVFGTLLTNGGVCAAGGSTFGGIVNCLAGMCVAAGITLSIPAGTRTHISQQGIRGAGFKIRNQVSFGFGSGDANEIDIGASGANITLAPTTNIVTIDTGLSTKTGDYQTGIRFLGYESMLGVPYNTLLIGGVGGGNTLYLPNGNGVLALSNDVVTRFNGLTGSVTGVTTGNANTFGPVQSFTNGISAAGGITFNAPISSTRLPRTTSAVFETKTANFSPTNADDGKVFVINHSSKTPVTVSLDSLSIGWRAKFISVNSGAVGFSSSLGTVYGAYGANGGNAKVTFLDPIVEVICYDTNLYFAG